MNSANSDPWRSISAELAPRLAHLAILRETFPDLLASARLLPPSEVDVAAMGYLLHGFYLLAEQVSEAVLRAFDEPLPQGEEWHIALINSVARPTAARPPLVSPEMLTTLHRYRSFRHVFRTQFPHTLRWSQMSALVDELDAALVAFRDEVQAFLDNAPKP